MSQSRLVGTERWKRSYFGGGGPGRTGMVQPAYPCVCIRIPYVSDRTQMFYNSSISHFRIPTLSPLPSTRLAVPDRRGITPPPWGPHPRSRPPAMVHSAYDAVELAAGVQGRIEAVASHAGKLLVATSDSEGFLRSSDCSLRIYSAPSAADGGEIRLDGPYTLERQEPRFWRRPPLAMEVSGSRDLLLSLSEWVALHRLPGLETVVAVSSKTKGANAIAWDDRRGLLAVGRQKRLTVFRLDSNYLIALAI
jgi:hypothetical protein